MQARNVRQVVERQARFLGQLRAGDAGAQLVDFFGFLVGVAELQRRVQEVHGAEDKQALYFARLEELLANADESGKLGIYRVGFEGGFDLQLDYTNNVVTVTATRKANA